MLFARTKDSERTLTIMLAAGKGVIIDAFAKDLAGNKITKAAPGSNLLVVTSIRNDGETDYIWFTIKDKDTGALVFEPPVESTLGAGKTLIYESPTLTMPDKTWNLLIEAGHGKK